VLIQRRLLLAAASGMSTWPLSYVVELLGPILGDADGAVAYTLIGGVFGALVLAPLVNANSLRRRRVIWLIVGAIFIYALTVELAVRNYGPLNVDYDLAVVASGILGALLVGLLMKLTVPLRMSGTRWAYLLTAGLCGGFLFCLAYDSNDGLIVSTGYIAWQVSVCLALNWGRAGDV